MYAAAAKRKRAEYAATAKRKGEEAMEKENDRVAQAHQKKYPNSTDPLLRRTAVEKEVLRIVDTEFKIYDDDDYLPTDRGKIDGALGDASPRKIFEGETNGLVYVGVTGRTLIKEGFEFGNRRGCVLNWTEDATDNVTAHGNPRDLRTLLPQQFIELGFYVISVYSSQHSQNAYMIESRLQKYLSSISAVRGKPRLWQRDDPGRHIEGAQASVRGNMHRVYVTVSVEAYEKIHGDDKQLVIT
jgi:hypothetical protein